MKMHQKICVRGIIKKNIFNRKNFQAAGLFTEIPVGSVRKMVRHPVDNFWVAETDCGKDGTESKEGKCMDRRTYKILENYMLTCMADSAHDKDHVYRVLYNGLEIARTEKEADSDVVIGACLLHDICRKEQLENPAVDHAEAGGEKAYHFLRKQGFEESYAEKVRECICSHRFRKGNPPQSLEAKILYDADKLEAVGAVGIARTLLYQGTVSAPLYTLGPDGTVSDGTGDAAPSFFREYKHKLEKLYSGFYTEKGRVLAEERRAAAADFYDHLLCEIKESYKGGGDCLEKIFTGQTILETKRLILRELTDKDYEALCLILQDEETMYAYEGAFDDAEARDWLKRQMARYRQWGFGLWAVVLKENGELIGQCGLTMQPWKEREVLEVGYLFQRAYWHQGYATEAAAACKKYAFEVLKAQEVCSIIRDINQASQRVARRNGMIPADTCIRHYKGVDMPHIRYVAEHKE